MSARPAQRNGEHVKHHWPDREACMDGQTHTNVVIDLGTELIIDRSKVRDPYVRLLLAAVGEPLACESPWVAVYKRKGRGRRATAGARTRRRLSAPHA